MPGEDENHAGGKLGLAQPCVGQETVSPRTPGMSLGF